MSKVRKAPMLAAAALVSFPLGGWDCLPWSQTKTTPDKKRAVRKRVKKKKTHKRVRRVKRSRTRTRSFSSDFSMPAGTAYDVIGCGDLQR